MSVYCDKTQWSALQDGRYRARSIIEPKSLSIKACPDDQACPTGKHCSHNQFQYTRWEGEWWARTEVRSQNDTIIW